jgi:uncharacterized protein
MRWLLILAVVAVTILATSCGSQSVSSPATASLDYGSAVVTINDQSFEAEVPLTQQGFYKGLMNRTELADDEAMLFDFKTSSERTFWMKNTLIPLDMLFIDENLTIRRISNAIPCKADPCPIYYSGAPVRYVLEIRGGLANELEVKEGYGVSIR